MEVLQFITLDVFTEKSYEGNPLAVVKIPSHHRSIITQEKKQSIAREFNLSETVFLHENVGHSPEWTIDIFTTDAELPFAGHPTVGAAFYVLNLQPLPEGGDRVTTATLITKSGPISISRRASGQEGATVQADIAHNVHVHKGTIGGLERPNESLSSHPLLHEAERNAPIVSIVKGMSFVLVRLPSLDVLAHVRVAGRDLGLHRLLDQDEGWDAGFVGRYYYVVEEGDGDRGGKDSQGKVVKIRTRMLDVKMEDPATGSAACALSSYLALKAKSSGRFDVTQGVEMGRTSMIEVEVVVDAAGNNVESVRLSGSAVQVMEGSLRI